MTANLVNVTAFFSVEHPKNTELRKFFVIKQLVISTSCLHTFIAHILKFIHEFLYIKILHTRRDIGMGSRRVHAVFVKLLTAQGQNK